MSGMIHISTAPSVNFNFGIIARAAGTGMGLLL
jgi:hypothetical protein